MGLGNILLLSQAAGYSVALILGLCVMIPMSLHLIAFKGNCLLYTTGAFVEEDGRFEPNWSSPMYCGFTEFVGLAIIITSLVQLIRMSIFVFRGSDSSFLSAIIDAFVSVCIGVVTLTNGILITTGFSVWCSSVTQRFASCETATVMTIGKDSGINATGFFIEIGAVQFGIWTSFVCWVLLFVLAGRKLFIYHERENIIVSMARERQRYTSPNYANLGEDD